MKAPTEAVVFVVDDDASLRTGLASLLRSVGLNVECFGSAEEFLQREPPAAPGCVVLDVRLPGVSGLTMQAELFRASNPLPVIFLTAHADVPMSVRAMKAGAVEFLTKPVRDQDLLDAVEFALQRDRLRRDEEAKIADLRASFGTLSTRERQILERVTAGLMNKQIAAEIGIAEITVKIHRGQLMRKMGARSLADLIKMAQVLDRAAPPAAHTRV